MILLNFASIEWARLVYSFPFLHLPLSLGHRVFLKKTRNISFFTHAPVQLSLSLDVTAQYVAYMIPMLYLKRLKSARAAIVKPDIKVSGKQTLSMKGRVES